MKFKLSWIHAEALIVYLIYTLGTKYIFFQSLLWRNEFRYYIPGPLISAFFGIIFLYFFSHEDFFKFAREVERREKKTEQKWLHKLIHFGKILTVFWLQHFQALFLPLWQPDFCLKTQIHATLLFF